MCALASVMCKAALGRGKIAIHETQQSPALVNETYHDSLKMLGVGKCVKSTKGSFNVNAFVL